MLKKIRCWDNQLKKYLTLEDYQKYHAIEVIDSIEGWKP